MAHNFGGFSAYANDEAPIEEMSNDGGLPGSPYYAGDGGDGSGVMRRHHVEGLPDLDRKPAEDSMSIPEGMNSGMSGDSLGPSGKKFTEHLHSRKSDGKFEPSSLRGKNE
jgi:hypothetical protein